jgi:hypothetical protein
MGAKSSAVPIVTTTTNTARRGVFISATVRVGDEVLFTEDIAVSVLAGEKSFVLRQGVYHSDYVPDSDGAAHDKSHHQED